MYMLRNGQGTPLDPGPCALWVSALPMSCIYSKTRLGDGGGKGRETESHYVDHAGFELAVIPPSSAS